MVREKGSIVVKERSATQQKVEEAYAKAEVEQWNTRDERNEGVCRWTGDVNTTMDDGEMNEDQQGAKWDDHRKKGNPKWMNEGKKIIPTCPPHPIVSKGGRKWKDVIENWVDSVRQEERNRMKKTRGNE